MSVNQYFVRVYPGSIAYQEFAFGNDRMRAEVALEAMNYFLSLTDSSKGHRTELVRLHREMNQEKSETEFLPGGKEF